MLLIGKIIGGIAGYWLAGMYGGVFGVVIGHGLDYLISKMRAPKDTQVVITEVDFAIKIIALGAKMAKADGVVTKDEITAFKEYFPMPKAEEKNVARVFNMAKRDTLGFEDYARQLVKLVNNDRQVLESVLDGLFHIANADNVLHLEEENFLRSVATIFGFSDDDFKYVLAYHSKALVGNPYRCLGVAADISNEALAKHHKQLVKDHHPDILAGRGLPEAVIVEREKKLARINAAYDNIKKSREPVL